MRFTVLSLAVFSALLLCCNLVTAQRSNKSTMPVPSHSEELSTASQDSKDQSSQPLQEIESLSKALVGEWSLSVKFEPSSSAPNGLVDTGEETWRPGPGGFTLLEEEHLRMPEGDLFLLGIIWWNATTKSLHGMECQNLLPYTCDVKGAQNDITMNWDGKQFVIDEMETSKSGQEICMARGLVRDHSQFLHADRGIWRSRRPTKAAYSRFTRRGFPVIKSEAICLNRKVTNQPRRCRVLQKP